MAFARGSGNRLTRHDLDRFPGDSLFERLARVVCEAGCLPRKELYETWEVARRVRRVFRGGRVADMAGGHGLLAHALLILDDSSPAAFVVDPIVPKSARRLHDLLVRAWPRLEGRIEHVPVGMDEVGLDPADVVVSCHACGALTDLVLSRASTARARVAVLPCCHDEETCDTGGLGGWLEASLAIDVVRAARLEASGYRVWTQTIPADITPKNRLLLGVPVGPGTPPAAV